jgi:hypothetical protein
MLCWVAAVQRWSSLCRIRPWLPGSATRQPVTSKVTIQAYGSQRPHSQLASSAAAELCVWKVHGPDKARQLCETLSLDELAGQLHR